MIISLHWAAGAVILALLGLGWVMVYGGLVSAATFDLYQWHKSLGFVALALTAARFAARLVGASPALASRRWERRLAAFTQGSLYVLAICAILSGCWLVVSTSPLPVPTRFFNLFVIRRRFSIGDNLRGDYRACL